DSSASPVFRTLSRLGELKGAQLRPFFREQMKHTNVDRRVQVILALGQLPQDDRDVRTLRNLVNDREYYAVVSAAVSVLGTWDAARNRDVFEKARRTSGESLSLRLAAYDALAKADSAEGRINPNADSQMADRMLKFLADVAQANITSTRMTG